MKNGQGNTGNNKLFKNDPSVQQINSITDLSNLSKRIKDLQKQITDSNTDIIKQNEIISNNSETELNKKIQDIKDKSKEINSTDIDELNKILTKNNKSDKKITPLNSVKDFSYKEEKYQVKKYTSLATTINCELTINGSLGLDNALTLIKNKEARFDYTIDKKEQSQNKGKKFFSYKFNYSDKGQSTEIATIQINNNENLADLDKCSTTQQQLLLFENNPSPNDKKSQKTEIKNFLGRILEAKAEEIKTKITLLQEESQTAIKNANIEINSLNQIKSDSQKELKTLNKQLEQQQAKENEEKQRQEELRKKEQLFTDNIKALEDGKSSIATKLNNEKEVQSQAINQSFQTFIKELFLNKENGHQKDNDIKTAIQAKIAEIVKLGANEEKNNLKAINDILAIGNIELGSDGNSNDFIKQILNIFNNQFKEQEIDSFNQKQKAEIDKINKEIAELNTEIQEYNSKKTNNSSLTPISLLSADENNKIDKEALKEQKFEEFKKELLNDIKDQRAFANFLKNNLKENNDKTALLQEKEQPVFMVGLAPDFLKPYDIFTKYGFADVLEEGYKDLAFALGSDAKNDLENYLGKLLEKAKDIKDKDTDTEKDNKTALEKAFKSEVLKLSGPAGTGKTMLIKSLFTSNNEQYYTNQIGDDGKNKEQDLGFLGKILAGENNIVEIFHCGYLQNEEYLNEFVGNILKKIGVNNKINNVIVALDESHLLSDNAKADAKAEAKKYIAEKIKKIVNKEINIIFPIQMTATESSFKAQHRINKDIVLSNEDKDKENNIEAKKRRLKGRLEKQNNIVKIVAGNNFKQKENDNKISEEINLENDDEIPEEIAEDDNLSNSLLKNINQSQDAADFEFKSNKDYRLVVIDQSANEEEKFCVFKTSDSITKETEIEIGDIINCSSLKDIGNNKPDYIMAPPYSIKGCPFAIFEKQNNNKYSLLKFDNKTDYEKKLEEIKIEKNKNKIIEIFDQHGVDYKMFHKPNPLLYIYNIEIPEFKGDEFDFINKVAPFFANIYQLYFRGRVGEFNKIINNANNPLSEVIKKIAGLKENKNFKSTNNSDNILLIDYQSKKAKIEKYLKKIKEQNNGQNKDNSSYQENDILINENDILINAALSRDNNENINFIHNPSSSYEYHNKLKALFIDLTKEQVDFMFTSSLFSDKNYSQELNNRRKIIKKIKENIETEILIRKKINEMTGNTDESDYKEEVKWKVDIDLNGKIEIKVTNNQYGDISKDFWGNKFLHNKSITNIQNINDNISNDWEQEIEDNAKNIIESKQKFAEHFKTLTSNLNNKANLSATQATIKPSNKQNQGQGGDDNEAIEQKVEKILRNINDNLQKDSDSKKIGQKVINEDEDEYSSDFEEIGEEYQNQKDDEEDGQYDKYNFGEEKKDEDEDKNKQQQPITNQQNSNNKPSKVINTFNKTKAQGSTENISDQDRSNSNIDFEQDDKYSDDFEDDKDKDEDQDQDKKSNVEYCQNISGLSDKNQDQNTTQQNNNIEDENQDQNTTQQNNNIEVVDINNSNSGNIGVPGNNKIKDINQQNKDTNQQDKDDSSGDNNQEEENNTKISDNGSKSQVQQKGSNQILGGNNGDNQNQGASQRNTNKQDGNDNKHQENTDQQNESLQIPKQNNEEQREIASAISSEEINSNYKGKLYHQVNKFDDIGNIYASRYKENKDNTALTEAANNIISNWRNGRKNTSLSQNPEYVQLVKSSIELANKARDQFDALKKASSEDDAYNTQIATKNLAKAFNLDYNSCDIDNFPNKYSKELMALGFEKKDSVWKLNNITYEADFLINQFFIVRNEKLQEIINGNEKLQEKAVGIYNKKKEDEFREEIAKIGDILELYPNDSSNVFDSIIYKLKTTSLVDNINKLKDQDSAKEKKNSLIKFALMARTNEDKNYLETKEDLEKVLNEITKKEITKDEADNKTLKLLAGAEYVNTIKNNNIISFDNLELLSLSCIDSLIEAVDSEQINNESNFDTNIVRVNKVQQSNEENFNDINEAEPLSSYPSHTVKDFRIQKVIETICKSNNFLGT